MSAPVDVLAVIDRDRGDAHAHRCGQFRTWEVIRREHESIEARAAVAELIDKAQFLVDGLDEEYVAWPTRVLMLKAALARIGGAA